MDRLHDLKSLEKKAFRSVHQDGLWDIYMGGIVASMATLAYSEPTDAFPFVRFSLFLLGMIASLIIFWAGKKFVTTPRLGQVKFGPRRQRRKRNLVIVLAGFVLVQALLLVGQIFLWNNPEWALRLGFGQTDPDMERLIVAVIGAMFVGPSMVMIAYFTDFVRGYYIAFIVSLGVFALIWFGNPIYMIAAGLLVIIPGVIIFVRFLRDHPRPPAEIYNG